MADSDANNKQLTMVLNDVNADNGEFISIGSIFSMNGMINGKLINIEDKDGIKKDNFTTKLTDALVPTVDANMPAQDEVVVNSNVASNANKDEILKHEAAVKNAEEKLKQYNTETPDHVNDEKYQELNKAYIESRQALSKIDPTNVLLKQPDEFANQGGSKRSRKAKRTKKGGKKRRNTLRRHRKSR